MNQNLAAVMPHDSTPSFPSSYEGQRERLQARLRCPVIFEDLDPSEQQELNELSSSINTGIASVQATLAKLRQLTLEAETEEANLRDLQLHCNSVVAPVRRLPGDILADIFIMCREGEPANLVANALNVSSVCSRWRDVALSCPQLWTEILVTCGSEGVFHSEEERYQMVQAFQERSGRLPLLIRVFISHLPHPPHSLFSLLAGSSERWRWLSINYSNHSISDTCWTEVQSFPNLRHLQVFSGDERDLLVFRDSPALRDLLIADWCGISALPADFFHIRRLELAHFHEDHVADFLQSLPLLGRLEVRISYCKPAYHPVLHGGTVVTRMASLRNASLSGRLPRFFMRQLKAPTLTTLSLLRVSADCMNRDFPAFLIQASPPLESLTVSPDIGKSYDFNPMVLHLLPKLKFLSILNVLGSAQAYEYSPSGIQIGPLLRLLEITWDGAKLSQPPLLPCLQHITFRLMEGFQSGNELAGMIGSRWWREDALSQAAISRLLSVRLELPHRIDPADSESVQRFLRKWAYEWLSEMQADGLNLLITRPHYDE